MKCQNCNTKVKKEDVFCPECGKNLRKKDYVKQVNMFLLKYKMKILYCLIAIIVLCLGVKITNYLTSPLHLANQYMKAIVANDYNRIYEMIDLNSSDLVSEKVLEDKITKFEAKEYKLEQFNCYGDEAVATYVYTKNNKTYRVAVILKQSMNKQFLFFDKWNVYSSKVANDIQIQVPEKSEVLLDNINIKDYLKEPKDGLDIYTIDEMITGEYTIKITLENGLSVEEKINIESDKIYSINKINLSDELISDLSSKTKEILNPIYNNVISSTIYTDTGFTNVKETYKYLQNKLTNRFYSLTGINFKEVEYQRATIDKNQLIAEFNVVYDYALTYILNNETKTYNGTATDTIYVSFNEQDKTYTVSELSSLPTNFKIYTIN